MTHHAPDLNLLMVHADDHAPVLADGLPDAAAPHRRDDDTPAAEAGHFWDEGGDPNDLAAQRWGVIAPQGPEGDRLLALVRPLIDHRQAQQGDAVKIYRVPAGMSLDAALRWKKREFDAGADLNIEVPRYQLILGDLDQVSLEVQQIQASDGYVGRLALASDDDYAAYVDKLLRWERMSEGTGKPDSLFFTVHDGTAATAVGHRALVGPGVEVVRRRQASGQYPAREIVEFGDRMTPSPDELLARVGGGDPSVLFTLSHGEGAPRGGWKSHDEQRRRQGAMSFGHEGKLTGDDLRTRPFLPGGVWFMLACYGAGTPNTSAYKHWLAQLAAAGQFRGRPEAVLAGLPGPHDRPFVAALPQAVLANPDGPLAFMGHIDLAWTYGFQELDDGATNRPARYMAITRSLLKRDRAGVSMRELLRFCDQTNLELTSLHDQEARPDLRASPASARPPAWATCGCCVRTSPPTCCSATPPSVCRTAPATRPTPPRRAVGRRASGRTQRARPRTRDDLDRDLRPPRPPRPRPRHRDHRDLRPCDRDPATTARPRDHRPARTRSPHRRPTAAALEPRRSFRRSSLACRSRPPPPASVSPAPSSSASPPITARPAARPRTAAEAPMGTHDLYDSTLRGALGCRAVWPPVLTAVQLGDYGIVDGGVFRRLGNVADFGLAFRYRAWSAVAARSLLRGRPAHALRQRRQVPAVPGPRRRLGPRAIEFGRGDGFVLKCARVELDGSPTSADSLARRLLAARAPDGQRWRPFAWRIVWQRFSGHGVFFFAARSAGSHVELDGSAELLHGIDAAAGSAGLSRHRAAGLGLGIVGDSGPIGLGLARVKLIGGVKFFSDDPDGTKDEEFVERLPAGADDVPDADEP
ncbi:hypothetical protein [Nannocystis sp.]|uniref:hypothetical protein n=1 Tax=Nannocystis sp. TaxID=1962667 RepID=UPI0025F5B474|nr:hypothetical protein [Nannocystis sp.]MBK7823630.1 hypothetical protein [Nannocystis sp.]